MDSETVVRAVTFPFTPLDGDWKAVQPRLNYAWGLSTRAVNWAIAELYLVDQLVTERNGAKIGPMPSLQPGGLYALFVRSHPDAAAWAGAKRQLSTVLNHATMKYAAKRLDVLGRGFASLPSFRFPYPYPVHNQSWFPYFGTDNVPCVSVQLPQAAETSGTTGARVHLRLRGGPKMRRQLARFRQLLTAKRGEMALYKRGRHTLAKLIGHFPLQAPQHGEERVMLVHTDPTALWVVELPQGQPRIWNQEHIRALVERHRIWRQRLSEDMKAEKRMPRPNKKHMLQALEDRCRKQNDRLETFCHEMSKQLAGLAARQAVSQVLYDDRNKSWLPLFPWARLRTLLQYKLAERGIALVAPPADSENETQPE